MQEKILQLIIETIRELNEEFGVPELENPNPQTHLYGRRSGLDSINLVTLITEIEEKVNDAFGLEIILADERAMSQTRSPFRRVETLAAYIETLLKEPVTESN